MKNYRLEELTYKNHVNEKSQPVKVGFLVVGGAGGDRTRVRKSST